ncbi:MAG TPA: penicillin-binding protein activator [Burkholderiales bacterium]|nr:penicillin-binding protein activator [Burkholderiales bacterium]
MVARAAEAATPIPHIALLLPLDSPSFGRHADAVRQGFITAAKIAEKNTPPIRVYAVNEDTLNVLAVYEQAIESGAQLVVGPLTRDGVAALAASSLVTVPTLALNTLEPRSPQPARLYLFGLSIELEARQIAQLAFDDGRRNAFVISNDTPLSKRMRQAFVEEFARFGGMVVAEFGSGADQASLSRLRNAANLGVADSAFLALDDIRASTVRPYLGNSLAVYATSHVNAGRSALEMRELNQVHFVDMPWILQADHPAVMVYPRQQFGNAIDFDRLYALGIDAFRIGLELLRQNPDPLLDGVTGRIRLTRDQQFVRELTAALFVDGKIVIQDAPR